jgi:hypothetical protein
MKKNLLYFLFLLPMAAMIVSCTPDDDDPDDVNTGDIRDQLDGTWKSQENSATYGPQNYYVEIIKDTTTSTGVKIDNFFNMGVGKRLNATVSGSTITLSSSPFEGFVFSGNGNVASNNKTINWSYTFFDGNETEQVTGTYTKL